MSAEAELYDVYVLKTSGLPLFSGCTASDYCMSNMEQHELQSGFLAAIHSFSKETFSKSTLQKLMYDDVKLSFRSDDELIMAFVHSVNFNDNSIEDNLKRAWNRFNNNYRDELDSILINEEFFQSFKDDLVEMGIIKEKLVSIRDAQLINEEKHSRWRPRILKWLRLRK